MKMKRISPEEIQALVISIENNDQNKIFRGISKNKIDRYNNQFIFGRIFVDYCDDTGYIIANANNIIELNEKLVSLTLLILDNKLHTKSMISYDRYGFKYSQN